MALEIENRKELNFTYLVCYLVVIEIIFSALLYFTVKNIFIVLLQSVIIFIAYYFFIQSQYTKTDSLLEVNNSSIKTINNITNIALIPVDDFNLSHAYAIKYGTLISKKPKIIHVYRNDKKLETILNHWYQYASYFDEAELEIIKCDQKTNDESILGYAHFLSENSNDNIVTIIIPELITKHLINQPLYANSLRMNSRKEKNIILIDIRLNI